MINGIVFLNEEEAEFENRNKTEIEMYKSEAINETGQYVKKATRNAQSKIGKIKSGDNINRNDLQSVSGGLNIDATKYYKKNLKNKLMQIDGMTEDLAEKL